MITIYRRAPDLYFVAPHREPIYFEFTEEEAIKFLRNRDIPLKEIELALADMIKTGNWISEFGNSGTFMFSTASASVRAAEAC